MNKKPNPKAKVEAFFSPEEIASIEKIAAAENRSRSAMIRELVLQAIEIRKERASA